MQGKIKKITALACAVLMLLTASACEVESPVDDYIEGQSAGEEMSLASAKDDVFSLNCNTESSFNPFKTDNTSNQLVCNLVYENLVEVDNNFELIPNVITSWKTEDNGKNWILTIDDSGVFHDGTAVTSEDVAYSIRCAASSSRYRSRLSYCYGCSSMDDGTVHVVLGKCNMQFIKLLTIPLVKADTGDEDYPTGSGPYTYAKDHKSLKAYKKYASYDTLPVDTVYLKEYSDVDDLIDAFTDSYVDIVMNDPTAPTNVGYGSANEIRGYNTTNMHYIGFNMYSDIFSYENMRFVMNFAFDREYLAQQYSGFCLASPLVISPACAYYDKSLASEYAYNLDMCKTILKNMGLRDTDDDGFLEQEIGGEATPIEIKFIVCNANSIKVNVARKFASEMEELGLKVTVTELTWDEYNEAFISGDYDMYYAEARMPSDFDPSKLLVKGAVLNYGGVDDEELEEYITAYLSADDDTRAEYATAMCRKILEGAYIIPLAYEKHQLVAHRGVVTGFSITENNPLYNVENWEINFGEVSKD